MAMTHDLGSAGEDVNARSWSPENARDAFSAAFGADAFPSAGQEVMPDDSADAMPAGEPPFEDIPWDEEAEAQYEEWARFLDEPDEIG